MCKGACSQCSGSLASRGPGSGGAVGAWVGGWASSLCAGGDGGGGGGVNPRAVGGGVRDGWDGLVGVTLPGKFGRGDDDGVEAAVVAMATG